MTVIISLMVGFVMGFFAAIITMILIDDHEENKRG